MCHGRTKPHKFKSNETHWDVKDVSKRSTDKINIIIIIFLYDINHHGVNILPSCNIVLLNIRLKIYQNYIHLNLNINFIF